MKMRYPIDAGIVEIEYDNPSLTISIESYTGTKLTIPGVTLNDLHVFYTIIDKFLDEVFNPDVS